MLVGYARVSTTEQDTALQRSALRRAKVRTVFEEQRSSVGPRPELERAVASLQAGDTLVVYKVDRLARSLSDLLSILRRIDVAGAGFRSLTEPIDTSSAAGRLMLQLLGAFAEFERSMICERTAAGMAAARERGARIGRPPALQGKRRAAAVDLVVSGVPLSEVARRFGVGVETMRRHWRAVTEAKSQHGL